MSPKAKQKICQKNCLKLPASSHSTFASGSTTMPPVFFSLEAKSKSSQLSICSLYPPISFQVFFVKAKDLDEGKNVSGLNLSGNTATKGATACCQADFVRT